MSTQLVNVLANVQVTPNERSSLLYAKARYAIDAAAAEIGKANAARAKTMAKSLRDETVRALDGSILHDPKLGRIVTFGDGTKAKY